MLRVHAIPRVVGLRGQGGGGVTGHSGRGFVHEKVMGGEGGGGVLHGVQGVRGVRLGQGAGPVPVGGGVGSQVIDELAPPHLGRVARREVGAV